jgi:hypothetical protein
MLTLAALMNACKSEVQSNNLSKSCGCGKLSHPAVHSYLAQINALAKCLDTEVCNYVQNTFASDESNLKKAGIFNLDLPAIAHTKK